MKRVLILLFAALIALAPLGNALASSPPTASPIASGSDAADGEGEAAPEEGEEPSGPTPDPTPEPSPTPVPTPSPLPIPPSESLIKKDSEGDEVIMLQKRLRDLGYFNYKITGQFGNFTEKALKAFQSAHGINPDGVLGAETASYLYSSSAMRGKPAVMRATPTPTPKPVVKPTYGTLVDWSKAKSFVARFNGPKFQVKDFWTGRTYYMKRVGGTLHMDVAPATAADTTAFKKTYGGGWSWSRRPVLVKFGSKWYAASINGYPHGSESVRGNGMNGQVCIHFLNSKTHVREMKDPDHQRCVQIAAGKR